MVKNTEQKIRKIKMDNNESLGSHKIENNDSVGKTKIERNESGKGDGRPWCPVTEYGVQAQDRLPR